VCVCVCVCVCSFRRALDNHEGGVRGQAIACVARARSCARTVRHRGTRGYKRFGTHARTKPCSSNRHTCTHVLTYARAHAPTHTHTQCTFSMKHQCSAHRKTCGGRGMKKRTPMLSLLLDQANLAENCATWLFFVVQSEACCKHTLAREKCELATHHEEPVAWRRVDVFTTLWLATVLSPPRWAAVTHDAGGRVVRDALTTQ
jgi:hypothetical protein